MTDTDVAVRAGTARKYLEVARLLEDEPGPADRQVAAAVAVLAAIAASDAICGAVRKEAPWGQSHDQAPVVLATVRGGDKLATALRRVLSEKTSAQYGTTFLSASTVSGILHNAQMLVDAIDDYVR